MKTSRLDGLLAVSAVLLVVVLTGTSISLVAEAMSRMSGQGYLLSVLLGIAVSVGLFVCQMALIRLTSRRSAITYILLASFVIAALSAWYMTGTSQFGTKQWFVGFVMGSVLPLQSVLLGSVAGCLFEMAGSGWAPKFKFFKPSLVMPAKVLEAAVKSVPPVSPSTDVGHTLVAPVSQPVSALATKGAEVKPVAEVAGVEPAAKPEAEPLKAPLGGEKDKKEVAQPQPVKEPAKADVIAAKQREVPVIVAPPVVDTKVGSVKLAREGEFISVRANKSLPKSKWKDLEQELRRYDFVAWEDAGKVVDQTGVKERILTGRIVFPELKGKKNRKKREGARERHIRAVDETLELLVGNYQK